MGKNHERDIAAFIIALLSLKGIGPMKVKDLLAEETIRINSAGRLDADFVKEADAANGSKTTKAIVRALETSEATWEELEYHAYETLALADDDNVQVLHPLMAAYPQRLLRNLSHPPILYCKGDASALNTEKAVAIVGTRNPTDLGYRMGRRLAKILAEDNYSIVSGLALGCDSAGHEGALDAAGTTVAILATPIDAPVQPKQNRKLAERILENNGALVSEYAPGIKLSNRQLISNLVARDKWQPGLSDGIIAIETSINGGTRHAMNHAIKTGTPAAVFDYSQRADVDFYGDPRFEGNVKYLADDRVCGIYMPQTIEAFKGRMDAYRLSGKSDDTTPICRQGIQIPLPLD